MSHDDKRIPPSLEELAHLVAAPPPGRREQGFGIPGGEWVIEPSFPGFSDPPPDVHYCLGKRSSCLRGDDGRMSCAEVETTKALRAAGWTGGWVNAYGGDPPLHWASWTIEPSALRRSADGRWIAQLSFGPRGHRRYKTRVARTKADARRKLEQLKADERAGLELSKLSLGAYLRRWLDDSARPTVSPNTLRGYRANLLHLAPIADVPLQRLTAEHIERCCNGMTTHRANAKTQKPASPKTVRGGWAAARKRRGDFVGAALGCLSVPTAG